MERKSANNLHQEVKRVTVASDVKTCLANLKSAQASLEQFALSTQNQEAKNTFANAAQMTQQIVDQISMRVQQLEQEEPQYKGF
jgi:translation initiation factor IF-2